MSDHLFPPRRPQEQPPRSARPSSRPSSRPPPRSHHASSPPAGAGRAAALKAAAQGRCGPGNAAAESNRADIAGANRDDDGTGAGFVITISSESPAATAALARALSPQLRAGDTLLLDGPIGAGKSHFARALIGHLLALIGRVEDVPSPTFTLVQTYDAGPVEIWHADLYRLTHPDEAIELGLDEAFARAICLVEWPGRLGADLPAGALHLRFDVTGGPDRPDDRCLTLSGGPRWAALLAALPGAATDPADPGRRTGA